MSGPAALAAPDTDLDGDADYTGTATSTFKEKAKFEVSGIGFNWTVGASAEMMTDLSVFVELDATTGGGMADATFKTDTAKSAFGISKIYYPVNLSTQLVRFGVNYKLPVQL